MIQSYNTIKVSFIALAIVLAASCSKAPEPDRLGVEMNIMPVFSTVIQNSPDTKSAYSAGDTLLRTLMLDSGIEVPVTVTRDTDWPIEDPKYESVLTKGNIYTGDADYETKSFRLYGWNASQAKSVLFSGKEYICGSNHKWSCANPPTWLDSEDVVALVGVWDSSETATASIEEQKYVISNYDVSGEYSSQKDLRVAFATYPANLNGDAYLYFNPYLTAVRVKIGQLPPGFKVTSVVLNSVGVKGTLVLPDSYTPANPLINKRDSYVGEWTDVTFGELSLANADGWTSGESVTPNGTAFLVINPRRTYGTMTITFTDSTNYSIEKTFDLGFGIGGDEIGKSFTYTIGLTSVYSFYLVNSTDAIQTFDNTDSPLSKEIPIKSSLKHNDGSETDVDWEIESVQVGGGTSQDVSAEFFNDIGGFFASRDDNTLSITASERFSIEMSSHDYWTNKGGISGDTGGSGWSPKSWGSDGENRGVIDLSKYDFQNETTNNPMTTANCYVIRHAGTYKLPLVYGNGIVNGAFNVQSYAPAMAAGGDASRFLSPFENHLGYGITSPFIEYNTSDGNPNSGNYLVPSGSRIVWQDEADIITIDGISKESVTVKNASGVNETFSVSYLTFTIPQDKICQNNAILAVTDAEGNIIWSWHIWTTNDPGLLQPAIPVKNHNGVTYNFFPLCNLGYIDALNYPARDILVTLVQKESGKRLSIVVEQRLIHGLAFGCYYQFGRKDPMCRVDNPAANGTGSFNKLSGGNMPLEYSIQNPDTFIGNDAYNKWCSKYYNNLWTGSDAKGRYVSRTPPAEFDQNPTMIKTVYDPSPVGYKIPAPNAFYGFQTVSTSSSVKAENIVDGGFNVGWNFYTDPDKSGDTIFFPASAYRNSGNGDLQSQFVDFHGYYWASNVDATTISPSAFNMMFYGSIYGGGPFNVAALSSGFSVRPVAEAN